MDHIYHDHKFRMDDRGGRKRMRFETIHREVDPFRSTHPEYTVFVAIEHFNASEKKRSGSRTFYVYNDVDHFIEDFRKGGCWHEYVGPGDPVRLYFDIDDTKKTADWDELIENIKNCVRNALGTDKEVMYLRGDTETKYSAHLIYPDVGFDNLQSLYVFARTVHAQLNFDSRIDMQVYTDSNTTSKCLRLPYCTAPGKGTLLPVGGPTEFDRDTFLRCMISQGSFVRSDLLSFPNTGPAASSIQNTELDTDPLNTRALQRIEAAMRKYWRVVHIRPVNPLDANTGRCIWHLQPGIYCPISKRRHRSNNTHVRITLFEHVAAKVECYCLDIECRQWIRNRDMDWSRIAFPSLHMRDNE